MSISLDQLEDAGDLLNVEAVDREAQAHLDARRLAVANAVQRGVEGARTARKRSLTASMPSMLMPT